MSEISDLMAKDPLSLTRPDITQIIAKYRADRGKFMAAGKVPKEAKPKGPKADHSGLSLDDLDL